MNISFQMKPNLAALKTFAQPAQGYKAALQNFALQVLACALHNAHQFDQNELE